MVDRLTSVDVSFLYLEDPTTPMHVGSVAIFQAPSEGFDYDRLVRLIRERIAFVPRYRQRVRSVPGKIANPVWVDDENFDVTYHVRRSALPRPGTDAQLLELVGRIMGRPLDRSRPLWEMYLVEGLEGGRFAVLSKTHHAMVDGISAVDIGQVILDVTPEPRQAMSDGWRPGREPSGVELVASALTDLARSPAALVNTVRSGLTDVKTTAVRVGQQSLGLVSALWTAARPQPDSPLNAEIGEQRRFGMAATRLEDYRAIRKAHGGTVNDVVLAVVTGALREWLMTRGEILDTSSVVRAMVPVSVHPDLDTAPGDRVAAFLVDLPVGEPQPVIRLNRISFEMSKHGESGRLVGAEALVSLAGFSAPTLHSLGARVGNSLSRRAYNLVVTNVPGPQFPLYAGGARLVGQYPVHPLGKGQAVAIGATSYDGGIYFGLNADRDAMPDIDVLADCLERALEELLDTTAPAQRRPRRRATPSSSTKDPQVPATPAAPDVAPV